MRVTGVAKVVLLLLGAIPAGIGIAAGHEVVGIVLSAIGEAFVLVTAFAAGIVKEVSTRWRTRLADRLDSLIISWTSQFGKKYHEYVLASLRLMEEEGPATTGFYRPELDEIYVDVSVFLTAPHQVPGGLLVDAKTLDTRTQRRRPLSEFLDQPERHVLAVIGGPGSGKTTLLRRTARETSRTQRSRRRRVPILLYLRDHVELIIRNPDVDVATLVHQVLLKNKVEEPAGWFERRLRAGNCVVLLDGLDEVARRSDREAVRDWIEHQISQYYRNDFVVTSRPQGYLDAKIGVATVLQVQNFTDQQVTLFIRRWYLAIEKRSAGGSGPSITQKAEKAARDLVDRLNGTPALYELTVNPLLLTMIVNVHRYRGALPGSRVDLYNEICQVMLWRRQEAKKLAVPLRGDKKELLLQRIAFVMMTKQTRDISRRDIIAEVRPGLRRLSKQSSAENFLADVGDNGLLVEREANTFTFAHQTFQEFLAAAYIKDKGRVDVLCDNVDDAWWRETTLLYAARSDADGIVEACLTANTVTSLSLAISCADEESELEPLLRERIERLLDDAFAPDVDQEWRDRLSGVIVNRHLREVVRTRDGSRVCVKPVSRDIYHLFLLATGNPAPDARVGEFVRSADPVVGVRSRDAIAFERWVNQVSDSQTPYQLVDLAHLKEVAAPGPWSVWATTGEDGERTVLWTPPNHHPHHMNSRTMKAHVHLDITESRASFARLVLVRALIEAQVTANNIEITAAQVRSRADARNRTYGDDLELALARARGRTGSEVMNTASTLQKARRALIDLSLETALDNTVEVLRTVGTAPAARRAKALEQGRELAEKLTADLEPHLARALALPDDFAQYRSVEECVGSVLSRVLNRIPVAGLDSWISDLADYFVGETIAERFEVVASPDVLTANAERAAMTVQDIYDNHDEEDEEEGYVLPTVWACRATAELAKVAKPVFERVTPVSAAAATAIRLVALCLAAEPVPHRGGIIGQLCRETAAGATLLERRAKGMSEPTETVRLAPR
jgi:hypothetical protein